MERVTLKGSVPRHNHKHVGPVDPHEKIDLIVKLPRKTEAGLPTLDEFVAGKRAFMSRHDLEERYGANAADAKVVERWARHNGLSVATTNLGRRQIELTGSADAVSKAFGVTLSRYLHARTGTKFRCPEGDISIPKELEHSVTGVFGLNDMPVVAHHRKIAMTAATPGGDLKTMYPGSFYPHEVAGLYNFPATTGKGEKVAVLEFGGGFDPQVLTDYFTNTLAMPVAPTVNSISVLNTQMDVDDEATGEVYLDIEVIGGMARDATIDVYFAPWSGKGYLTAIEQAIHNDDYAAISISYGLDEDLKGSSENPAWPALNKQLDEAFRDANAVGIPVFVSSGDQGSSGDRATVVMSGQQVEVTAFTPVVHADYPASSPYVTAVGGTMLYANGKTSQEIVWNELGQLLQNSFFLGGATGGGVSDRYSTPSYQARAGIKPTSANGGTTGRGIPDVAGNAGSSTGYLVSQPPSANVPIAPVGGTSAASPMWAALMACVREALNKTFNGAIPQFFFNDFVYAIGKNGALRDIVGGRVVTYDATGLVPGDFTAAGNNRSSEANGYTASAGFDLCTGWGTPNGVELLKQLTQWLQALPKPT